MKYSVSIIVPAYNCGEFLPKCLNSLVRQTLSDIQIIVINDGSTDNTGKIADQYKNKYNNIVVIHKKNEGVSSARNVGLECAEGEYIGFVDADDHVEPDMFEKLYSAMVENSADIAECDYYYVEPSKITCNVLNLKSTYYDITKMELPVAYLKLIASAPFLWNKLYRASLIKENSLCFSLEMGEDCLFNLKLLSMIKSAVTIEKSYYYYYYRKTSITNTHQKDYVDTINEFEKWQFEEHLENTELTILLTASLFTGFFFSLTRFMVKWDYLYQHIKSLTNEPSFRKFCKNISKENCLYKERTISRKFFYYLCLFGKLCNTRMLRTATSLTLFLIKLIQRKSRHVEESENV